MFLSWVGILGGLVILGTIGFTSLHANSKDWIKTQIELDNLAIEMGREERMILRDIETEIKLIRSLEVEHHSVHACARVPQTAAQCGGVDKTLETVVIAKVESMMLGGVAKWRMSKERASVKLASIGKNGRMFGTLIPPYEASNCVCGLRSRLRRLATPVWFRFETEWALRVLRVGGSLSLENGDWDYKLNLGM